MKTIFAFALTALSILAISSASAQSLYWDPSGSSGSNLGGSGNWDTSDMFWYNGSSDVAWVNNDDAYFTNNSGTVTLTQNINAGDLYFTNTPGYYIITNATGVETLTLANGVVDTGGTTNTIGAILAGSTTLTKNGNGTLILDGNNRGFTGLVNVNQGALRIFMTTNALGAGKIVTVTNGASLEFASGSVYSNALVVSGGGVNNEGALFDATNWIFSATTNYGALTLPTTNAVFGCTIGTLYLEGGITAASGINANVILNGPGVFRVSAIKTGNALNLHTGSITVNGGEFAPAATSVTYSNLVLNGAELSSGYSADTALGTAPSAFNATSLTISNGANMLFSHTFTFSANRGIYLGPGGGDIGENTGNGQLTIPGAISGPGPLVLESDGSGASVKLTGNNSYSGLTTIQSAATLVIGSGSTTGTFGTSNVVNAGTLTVNRGGTLTYAGSISGTGTNSFTSVAGGTVTFSGPISTTGPLSLAGAGTIIFSGSNTYSANTVIACQYFLVDNTNGSGTSSGSVTVGSIGGGSFLGGTGIISGPVTVVQANTLQPGNPITSSVGTLAISNTLTLQPASFTTMSIKGATGSSVIGVNSLTFGGTLTVTNIGGTPPAGTTYQLFSAGSYSGNFESGVQLPTLSSGLFWNTNNLYVNGSISVMTTNGIFNQPVLSGNKLILSGTEGSTNGTYSVLSSTNLLLPIPSWTVVSTGNPFDSSGNFKYTNTISPGSVDEFFMIRQP